MAAGYRSHTIPTAFIDEWANAGSTEAASVDIAMAPGGIRALCSLSESFKITCCKIT